MNVFEKFHHHYKHELKKVLKYSQWVYLQVWLTNEAWYRMVAYTDKGIVFVSIVGSKNNYSKLF